MPVNRRLPSLVVLLLTLCAAAFATPRVAGGNGGFIPPVGIEQMPDVPLQRAIIIHRNGVETLIVESAFDAHSAPDVAWILPLPSVPTRLATADPGTPTSALLSLRAAIVTDSHERRNAALVIGAITLSLAVIFAILGPGRRRKWVRIELWTVFALLMGSMCLLPTLGKGRGLMGGDAFLEANWQRVGGYDVAVLTPPSADAFAKWLDAQGLRPLAPLADAAVERYIATGWCFAVTRLHPTAGIALPEPLVADVRTPAPVFPMQLTAVNAQTTPTHVELVVIADTQVAAPGFSTLAADRFDPSPPKQFYANAFTYTPTWTGRATGMVIGSPDLAAHLWPGCHITRLQADLSAADMTDDVHLIATADAPRQQVFHTATARNQIVATVSLAGLAFVCVVYVAVTRGRRWPSFWARIVLGAMVALTLVATVATFAALPTTPAKLLSRFGSSIRWGNYDLLKAAVTGSQDGRLTAANTADPAAFHALLQAQFPDWRAAAINDLTGEPITRAMSPGNYTVRTIDGQTWFCVYDLDTRETRVPIALQPAATASAPATAPAAGTPAPAR